MGPSEQKCSRLPTLKHTHSTDETPIEGASPLQFTPRGVMMAERALARGPVNIGCHGLDSGAGSRLRYQVVLLV